MADVDILARARTGTYRGTELDGTAVFKGVRYATASRFRPPVAVGEAQTEFSADSYSAQAPQLIGVIEQMLGGGSLPMAEDCHFLNIYTPSADGRRRPVLVWIHGGAFFNGSGAMPWYHGTSLANRGDVVVVTINYRLGALGFTDLGSIAGDEFADAGNLGLLDQIAALEWVQTNIEAFGGDPANVTVFGESAGGASVVALLGTAATRNLFHRAIAMSPSLTQLRTSERAKQAAGQLLSAAGVGIDELLTLPLQKILDAQSVLIADAATAFTAFSPTPHGTLFGTHPLTAAAANEVPLLIGTNRDEMLLYAQFDPTTRDLDEAALRHRAASFFGGDRADQAIQLYRRFRGDDTPPRLAAAMTTDETFRAPAWRLAQERIEHRLATWMYWFTWPSPAFGGVLGACHAVDIPFTFHNLDRPGVEMFTGDSPDRAVVADAVSSAVTRFASTGSPGWKQYDEVSRSTRQFDIGATVLAAPEEELRQLWSSAT